MPAAPGEGGRRLRPRPRGLRETPMIDIVLLVLKIGILVLLYLFIWQVVKTAVQNARGGAASPAGRGSRTWRCRPATRARRRCSRRRSGRQRREDR